MKATDIIARDHRAAEALYEKFKQASEEDKKDIEHELFAALNAHEVMEDTHFYPALKEVLDDDQMLEELDDEQTSLKVGATGAHVKETILGPDEESVEKVMEKVLDHARKEEEYLFPLAEEMLTEAALEELGERMEPMSAVAQSRRRETEDD